MTDPPSSPPGDRVLRARGRARLDVRARVGAALPGQDALYGNSIPTPRSASRRASRRSALAGSSRTIPWCYRALGAYYETVNPIDSSRDRGVHSGASGSLRTTSTCSGRSRERGRPWATGTARRLGFARPRCSTPVRRAAPRGSGGRAHAAPAVRRGRLGRRPGARARADNWSTSWQKVMVALGQRRPRQCSGGDSRAAPRQIDPASAPGLLRDLPGSRLGARRGSAAAGARLAPERVRR